MKASELRLGNWVSHNGKPFQVYAETFCDIESTHLNPDPIPLTEEWLIKFGFMEIEDDGLWGHPSEELFQLQSKYLEGEGKFNHIWDASYTEAPIEFMHQLQNLYFALTGEELTIKETV